MGKMKKAMFYTVGFILLSSILLALAVIIAKTSIDKLDTISKISALDRSDELVISIQDGFVKIFKSKSGITVASGDSVSFREDLPNENNAIFNNYLDNYKEFIDSKNLSISLNINELKTNLPLRIMPNNIEYKHLPFEDAKIVITAQSSNFDGYSLEVTSTSQTIDCVITGSAQTVYLKTHVVGVGDECTTNTGSEVRVNGQDQTPIATFQINGDDLIIKSYTQINIKTSIDNLDDLGKKTIQFPDSLIYLNYSDFNIVKNTTVKL